MTDLDAYNVAMEPLLELYPNFELIMERNLVQYVINSARLKQYSFDEEAIMMGIVRPQKSQFGQAVLLSVLVQRNIPQAEFTLGRLYMFKFGLECSIKTAEKYLRDAAAHGIDEALLYLAVLHIHSIPEGDQDANAFLLEAMQKGVDRAHPLLALIMRAMSRYIRGTNLDMLRLVESVGQKGDILGCVLAAEGYMDSAHSPQLYNPQRGVELLRSAVDKGSGYACYLLAKAYLQDVGVKYDVDKVGEFLKLGMQRECGHAYAMFATPPYSFYTEQRLENFIDTALMNAVLPSSVDLAKVYYMGLYGVKKRDVDKAKIALTRGTRAGCPEALLAHAKYMYITRQYEKCLEMCKDGEARRYPGFFALRAQCVMNGLGGSMDEVKVLLERGMEQCEMSSFQMFIELYPDNCSDALEYLKDHCKKSDYRVCPIIERCFLPVAHRIADELIELLQGLVKPFFGKPSPDAMVILAKIYLSQRTNDKEALALLETAKEMNSVDAIRLLGHLYKDGVAVKQNSDTALQYFDKAYSLGDPKACGVLAQVYMDGKIAVCNRKRARWYAKIGAYRHDPESAYLLSRFYMERTDKKPNPRKAKAYLLKTAFDDKKAAKYMATLFISQYTSASNLEKATTYTMVANYYGSLKAIRVLALALRGAQEYDRAIELLQENMLRGDAKSFPVLMEIVLSNRQLHQKVPQIANRVIDAVRKGEGPACQVFGQMMMCGFGVPPDVTQAFRVFRHAIGLGFHKTLDVLFEILGRNPTKPIAEIIRLAKEVRVVTNLATFSKLDHLVKTENHENASEALAMIKSVSFCGYAAAWRHSHRVRLV